MMVGSMRLHLLFLLGLTALELLALGAADVRAADAQDPAIHVATYIETLPQAKEAVLDALKSEAAACRKDGCHDVHLLQEIGRDNRFVVLESWPDLQAFAAHERSTDVQYFRDQLTAIATAPPDERILAGVWRDGLTPQKQPAEAVWVVTHVDVMPSFKDQTAMMLERLGEGSTKEPGHMLFAVTRQPDRPNHLTVMEAWADRTAFEAHESAIATKQFRDELGPMLGALYDQRIYRAIE